MEISRLQNREQLHAYMVQDPFCHLYKLADLDDHFFPNTEWHVMHDPEILALVTVYHAPTYKSVIAQTHGDTSHLLKLLDGIENALPDRFHSLVAEGVASWFKDRFQVTEDLLDIRMGLEQLAPVSCPHGFTHRPLSTDDLGQLQDFYDVAYPTPFYDDNLVGIGAFEGVFQGARLVAVAGVHTISERWRVAALGNIAVHPEMRGKGLGMAVTSLLCSRLQPKIDHIGLNVHATNLVAQKTYATIGFRAGVSFRELNIAGRV